MKRFLISVSVLLLTVSLVNFLQEKTYSNYKKDINVNINDKTGKLVCDATLDNPGNYVSDDGWAYFKVIVVNYDNDNVSDVPIEFNINVKNKNGSNATYRISSGSDVSSFGNNIVSSNYQFTASSRQTREFLVEVKTNNQDAENIDFDVDLNCYQIAN